MNKVLCILLCCFLAGCGNIVEIPPAHKGKVFTSGGYQPGIINPSTLRLPWEFRTSPKLVIAEVSDQGKEEKMTVFMPSDQLILAKVSNKIEKLQENCLKRE